MIDFDKLVLNPLEDIFSIRVRFIYATTQPNAPPYETRGIFSYNAVDVGMLDDAILADHSASLGIRLLDFVIIPQRGDLVEMIDPRHPSFGAQFWIGDCDMDGQAGARLLLRTKEPA